MIIQWKDNSGNLYEAKLYGDQDYPNGIIKRWGSADRKSAKARVHEVLYKRGGNIPLSDLSVELAERARKYGCPDRQADRIMECGFYRYKDGKIPSR